MTIHSNRIKSNNLNANPDPKHFSYKVLGMLSWGVLIFCFASFVVARDLLLNVARLIAIYMMVRFIALTIFYLVGMVKIWETEKRVGAIQMSDLSGHEAVSDKIVHHLVVIPNYKEPADILSRTLESLTVQAEARHNLTVILGMEGRELGA
jgi:hypothetical protein